MRRLLVCAAADISVADEEKKGTKHHKKLTRAFDQPVCLFSSFFIIIIIFITLSSSLPRQMLENHKLSHSSRGCMTKAALKKKKAPSPSAVVTGSAYISLYAKTAFGSVKLNTYL